MAHPEIDTTLSGRTTLNRRLHDWQEVAVANSWIIVNVGGGPTDDKRRYPAHPEQPGRGTYDIVTVGEFPDDETASAMTLSVAMAGNVRTETMRAYTAGEMQRIIQKLP